MLNSAPLIVVSFRYARLILGRTKDYFVMYETIMRVIISSLVRSVRSSSPPSFCSLLTKKSARRRMRLIHARNVRPSSR